MKNLFVLIAILIASQLTAQNVSINNTGAVPNTNAMLDIDVTTNDMGLLIPRMTTIERNAIAGLGVADEGLTVYDEITDSYWLWDGFKWVIFGMGKSWLIEGNFGITASHFLGPINNVDLNFRTNNDERMSIESNGQVYIGSTGTVNYATGEGDLYVQDIIEVDDDIYLIDHMYHGDDDNTFWDFNDDAIFINTGGFEMLRMTESGQGYVTFNEGSANVDFRIESDLQNDMFFVDASTSRIGINTMTPTSQYQFISTGATGWVACWDNTTVNGGMGRFQHSNASNGSRVLMGTTNYSGSVLQAASVIGLSLNSSGTGGVGVLGSANNERGNAVEGYLAYSGAYTGWAGYFNANVYSAGGFFVPSDRRFKKDVNPIENALDIIKKIDPVSYYFDTEKYPTIGFEGDRLSYGFIAQDLEQIVPTMVKEKTLKMYPEGPMTADMSQEVETALFKVVDYTLLIPILTQAIKEQQVIIEDLEQRLSDLEQKINAMD